MNTLDCDEELGIADFLLFECECNSLCPTDHPAKIKASKFKMQLSFH